MYKRMLVPLDGSELAEVVMPYAKELAGRLDLEVVFLHVQYLEEHGFAMHRVYVEHVANKIGHEAREIQTTIGTEPGTRTAETRVELVTGEPAEEILRYADENHIDLILMATHGRSGIRRWVLGSVADRVLHASKVPIWLVRANIAAGKRIRFANVLVPLDGSKQSETVLPFVENLASKLKSKVILLHVIAQPYNVYAGTEGVVEEPYTKEELKMKKIDAKNYLERVGKAFAEKGIRMSTQLRVGNAAEEIIDLAEELDIDIVAMSTHGRSGFSRWGHGSVADKVLHSGSSPLLLVREPAGKQKREIQETATESETINSLVGDLASNDGVVRVKARKLLVTMGEEAVGPVVEALKSRRHWMRWEAAKTLAQIGNPTATQALINALDDNEFDVRWLAAEGLIHIGAEAIEPLLKALTESPDSLRLREGAHHVLHDLLETNFPQTVKPVLTALEDVQPSLEVASAAEAALDMISQYHS